MPPKLALFACTFFVIWVYRRDSKTNPYSTKTLWLPTLWMMRCGSRGVDAWLGGGDNGRWDPIVIAVLVILGSIALVRRGASWDRIIPHNSALFIFYGYMMLSLTWADALENPAVKVMRPMGDLIMALIVVTDPDPQAAIITIFRRTAIFLIPMSITLIKYFPDLGRMTDKHWGTDSWIGVATHKNPLGQLCIVSAFAFLWALLEARRRGEPLKKQRLVWLYIAFTANLLFLGGAESRSSTSLLCLFLAIGLFLAFGHMRTQIQLVIRRIFQSSILIGLIAVVLQVSGTSLQALVAGSVGKDPTLTDRTYLWADVLRLGMDNPVLGSGYGGFWIQSIYPKLSPEVDNFPLEAHNGYLETFANLGLLGVVLLFAVIIQSIRSAANTMTFDFEYGRLRLALLFMVVVMNYSEATFPRGNHLWWFGFLIVALSAGPPMAAANPIEWQRSLAPETFEEHPKRVHEGA